MSVVTLSVRLRNGEVLEIQEPVSPDHCRQLLSLDEEERLCAEDQVLERIRLIEGWDAKAMRTLWLSVDESSELPVGTRVKAVSDVASVWGESPKPRPAKRRLSFCFSFLSVAVNALPQPDRQEALDEWVDELRCAAEESLPILRRTASILVRALPSMALHGRFLSRARRPS
jgi:hypothetical protein